LHIASAQGYETVVRALAERGANLNARNARGQTPLGALLARKGRPNMIELLRKLGAGM
jgi:ankyrin repeat protein